MRERFCKGNYRDRVYRIMLAAALAAALFPAACNYIMNGGIISEWIGRTEELSVRLSLFPSAEMAHKTQSMADSMNSNLWFFPAGLLYRVSGRLVLTYRVYMAALQAVTLLFAKMFFEKFFSDKGSRLPALTGVVLYMTAPYRIYICYDLADLSAAVVWMLLPLYGWALLGLFGEGRKAKYLIVSSFALAGIGYAQTVCFFVLSALTVIALFRCRRIFPGAAVGAGALLLFPVLRRLFVYLFLDGYGEYGIPVSSIMQSGYRFGQIFSSYAFRDGHPGMGLGMLLCLIAGARLAFVCGEKSSGQERFFAALAVLLLIFSMRFFPWDMVQRLGVFSLKLVSLMNTPAMFAGMAFGCLCIPAASAVWRTADKGDGTLPANAVPLAVLLACFGVCIYQCNMLTYSRLPMA